MQYLVQKDVKSNTRVFGWFFSVILLVGNSDISIIYFFSLIHSF